MNGQRHGLIPSWVLRGIVYDGGVEGPWSNSWDVMVESLVSRRVYVEQEIR